MTEFRVTWEIDIEADSPQDAARQALAIQRDPASWATVFEVVNEDTAEAASIDLSAEPTGARMEDGTIVTPWDERLRAAGGSPIYGETQ